jgi:hypothetical protein
VPYNRFLTLLFECHINIEILVNSTAIKYLYKYITKGHDMSYMKVEGCDETKAYVDAQYVSSPKGMHFAKSSREPSADNLEYQPLGGYSNFHFQVDCQQSHV